MSPVRCGVRPSATCMNYSQAQNLACHCCECVLLLLTSFCAAGLCAVHACQCFDEVIASVKVVIKFGTLRQGQGQAIYFMLRRQGLTDKVRNAVDVTLILEGRMPNSGGTLTTVATELPDQRDGVGRLHCGAVPASARIACSGKAASVIPRAVIDTP